MFYPNKKNTPLIIILIAVLLLVLIINLNYFNVLRLSQMFPNLFGFLPHVSYETAQQSEPNTTPDANQRGKQLFNDTVSTIVSVSYHPSSFSINFHETESDQGESLATWETQDGMAFARYEVSSGGENLRAVYILFDYNTNASASSDIAQQSTSQFFQVSPKEEFYCKDLVNGQLYCESFWTEEDGTKRGTGIQTQASSSQEPRNISVFYCQFTQESLSYSWQSCAPELAQIGTRN